MQKLVLPLLLLCLVWAASTDNQEWTSHMCDFFRHNFLGFLLLLRLSFATCKVLCIAVISRQQVVVACTNDFEEMDFRGRRSVTDSDAVSVNPRKVVSLSWHPRLFLYKNFLTDDECDHLMNLARNKLTKSLVADNDSGKSLESEVRTSSGMFLDKAQDEVVKRIEDKIAAWTLLPPENGEAMQVLKYEDGQKYEPHVDYFHDKYNQVLGGHRIATVLMYLCDVIKGGETVFPNVPDKITLKDDSWSDCGKSGVAVKPRKGDALLFYSLNLNNSLDESSLHQGCPVIDGEKWSVTKWIHVYAFEEDSDAECVDENEMCGEWAVYGECEKNPAYMVGNESGPGSCRKSCKVC